MHRDVSVPIITLTGVISVTDLLPEMPIPIAIRQFYRSSRSLLFHPRLAQRALNLLCEKDETLISQLVHSLIQTSTDHIEVQEKYAETKPLIAYQENVPELLRAVIATNPDVFKVTLITSSDMSQFVDMNQPSTPGVQAYRFNVLQPPTPISNPVSNNIDTNEAPTPMLCRACAERQRLGLLSTPAQLTVTLPQELSTTSDKKGPTSTAVSNRDETSTMDQFKQLRGPSPAQAGNDSSVPAMKSHNIQSKEEDEKMEYTETNIENRSKQELESHNIRSVKESNEEMEYMCDQNESHQERATRQGSSPVQAKEEDGRMEYADAPPKPNNEPTKQGDHSDSIPYLSVNYK